MRQTLPKLREGDLVFGQVIEVLSAQEFMVSLEGDLVRVQNDSLRRLSIGDELTLRVHGLKPLQLKIYSGPERVRRSLDLKI